LTGGFLVSSLQAIVRITYFLTCLVGLFVAGWVLVDAPQAVSGNPFRRGPDFVALGWTLALTLVFGATSLRALWRVARRRPLLANARLAEMPVLAMLITLASAFAHLLVTTIFLAIWGAYPDFDGNAAGPMMLALMLYAFSLLTAEAVIDGRVAQVVRT
jgi:hypothetical protein